MTTPENHLSAYVSGGCPGCKVMDFTEKQISTLCNDGVGRWKDKGLNPQSDIVYRPIKDNPVYAICSKGGKFFNRFWVFKKGYIKYGTPSPSGNGGYLYIKAGTKHIKSAGRSVWEAFNPDINIQGYDIHHKDGDKLNNDLSNLTPIETNFHRRKHKLTNSVYAKREATGKILKFDSLAACGRHFNRNHNAIRSRIQAGREVDGHRFSFSKEFGKK